MGEHVPPDLDYLVNRLHAVNLTASSWFVTHSPA
jgi:hypothetical protein